MTKETVYQNDYSLLRKFDLDAAKSGEAVCYIHGRPVAFIAGPDSVDDFCVLPSGGEFYFCKAYKLRMAPLCWVDGKPVYKGDVLWQTEGGGSTYRRVASCIDKGYLHFGEGGSWATDGSMSKLSWTPPMVKREGWIVANIDVAKAMTKERAEEIVGNCQNVRAIRIEWEEPA